VSPTLVTRGGRSPIVLVAPHAGRRDDVRRPWGSGALKMNDLYTGPLSLELAERLDASAIVNDGADRNDVDLNRIGAACSGAPHFLETLAATLEATLARHPRAIVLTIHGWNVVQPAVDLGLGTIPSGEPFQLAPGAAVSADFAATQLRAFMGALEARGIAATPGLRYAARARENLLQLFTSRHRDDTRPLVQRLARLAPNVDAVQLELALPLRMPGRWRTAFVDACPALLSAGDASGASWPQASPAPAPATLEFVADGLSGLAALDAFGGRLLLFFDDGSLVTFTGERIGSHDGAAIAGLHLRATERGLALRYDGPMLRFADTLPFLDLERGLAGATLVEAHVQLELTASHPAEPACPFGDLEGRAALDGVVTVVRGRGRCSDHPRRLGAGARAALVGRHGGFLVDGAGSYVCRDGRHVSLHDATLDLAGDTIHLRADSHGADSISIAATVVHRLPVVRGGPAPGRLLLAACRTTSGESGWVELPGH
jgi:predicted heme/steroid binding protein